MGNYKFKYNEYVNKQSGYKKYYLDVDGGIYSMGQPSMNELSSILNIDLYLLIKVCQQYNGKIELNKYMYVNFYDQEDIEKAVESLNTYLKLRS